MTNTYAFAGNSVRTKGDHEAGPNLTSANGEHPFCEQLKCGMISNLDYRPMVASSVRARIETVSLNRGEVIRLEKNSEVKNIETKNGVI
jgi:hypothetical protein